MSARAVLTAIARKVGASLTERGFERQGLKFIRRVGEGGFISLIELQPSRKSTPADLLFVINFGIVVPRLSADEDPTKPEYGGCHWGGRVSDNYGVEIWWPVRVDDDIEQLAARVTDRLEREVLPALGAMQRDEDLIALWRRGQSPLLVDSQRLLFLGILLHRAGRRREFEEIKTELEGKARDSFSLRAVAKLKELDGRAAE